MIDNSINLVTGTSTFSTDINFYLLALNVYNTPALANTAPGARIKQSKIYISNVLVRDFIPVRVGSVGYLYDRVSKRLFGNKGTGNFVLGQDVDSELQQIYQNKLIEGVDYETADWLKYTNWSKPEGENALLGAYLICNLKVTTILNFTLKLGETIRMNNSDVELIVRSSTRTYYIRRSYFNNNIAIYSPASTIISNNYNLGTELDFLITDEGLFVNDVHLINEKIEYINQFGNYRRSCTGSISRVTTEEGVDVLVPCTLLHSIPRNLDAQCKERVAGECGMIDLISGKFYGNVANSGTFTVENDNNE